MVPFFLIKGVEGGNCVLQWRYVAGNNWGICSDGKGALGCGPQEEFRACADITIGKNRIRFVISFQATVAQVTALILFTR